MNRVYVLFFAACLAVSFTFVAICAKKPAKPPIQPGVGVLTKVWTAGYHEHAAPGLSIRVLILRHAPEQMAVDDADLVVDAVNKAKAKGLDIKVIGNHLVRSLSDLQNVVNSKVTQDATAGDTLIVHTIGHGSAGGYLQALGQRDGVMAALVDAAARNKQEMVWWQLSCYAAARLPQLNGLSPEQRDLFSNLTSSDANRESPAGVQGRIMAKVFLALAEGNTAIDPNQDGMITASELKNFLNSLDGARRGDLLFAQSSDEPIFGCFGPWMLPIIDKNGPQREYDRNFIPIPRRLPTKFTE